MTTPPPPDVLRALKVGDRFPGLLPFGGGGVHLPGDVVEVGDGWVKVRLRDNAPDDDENTVVVMAGAPPRTTP